MALRESATINKNLPPGAKIGLNVSRFDERQRRLRLVLPKAASCCDYAPLIDLVVHEPGIERYRFLGQTVADRAALLQRRENAAVVIPDTLPMPSMADQAAIPRAYTTKASEGLGYYATDVMRFKAAPAGRYRIFCGVPGHGLSGMWIRLQVDSTAQAPAMLETPTNR